MMATILMSRITMPNYPNNPSRANHSTKRRTRDMILDWWMTLKRWHPKLDKKNKGSSTLIQIISKN